MTQTAQIAEADVTTVGKPATAAAIAEADVTTVGKPPTSARLSEADVIAVGKPPTDAAIADLDVTALVYFGPCATARCQLWTITRRDGTVFRFTTLDEDFTWGAYTWKTCSGVNTAASEAASDIGAVGSTEIGGVFADDAITEADLYAGKWDDAYLEAWLVSWDGEDPVTPVRLAAGWTGKVTRGEHAWSAEVLGVGAKLKQASLVSFYTPACRWEFGSTQCGVDVESLKLATQTVTADSARNIVYFTHSDPGGSTIWNGGRVRWLSGRNTGLVCQVQTVDFSAGALSLWDLAGYPPQAGDTFDLLPGCPKTKTGCQAYSNYINFGGFPDVPGPDAMQSNADSLFTGANG